MKLRITVKVVKKITPVLTSKGEAKGSIESWKIEECYAEVIES